MCIARLRRRPLQGLVDTVLLALRRVELTQNGGVFARLGFKRGRRSIVGCLSRRNLRVIGLQVDEDLRERGVDPLQLRLQGGDSCLRLGGRISCRIAVPIGANRQGLAHCHEGSNRKGQGARARSTSAATVR